MTGDRPFHSVTLDPDKCVGCTTCIKTCPTEAIRVRKGRARIIDERCIDCGECIRTCPHGAKKAVSDPLALLADYDYRVALPAPSLYAQYDERSSLDRILSGLLELGFDEVFEVAEAAEIVSAATAALLSGLNPLGAPLPDELPRPLLSSACPAVVKLVQVRFPSLIPHLAPVLPPLEVAARIVKERLHPGRERVGVFFISPCAAKVTTVRAPLGYDGSAVDGVIGIKDLYIPLRAALARAPERALSRAGARGLEWARTEGESEGLGLFARGAAGPGGAAGAAGAVSPARRRVVSVDGIAQVIALLEALENGKLKDVDFVEANACPAGCVGGPLTAENPFIARARLKARVQALPCESALPRDLGPPLELGFSAPVIARPSRLLDTDIVKAMEMLETMDRLAAELPGLDCGSCGAPSCQALAEDVVRGGALLTDCIFKLRENVRELAGKLLALEEMKPPGLDKE